MSKKKKIMTISDLYKFCIKNNFCHFSSSTNNEEICVQMPAIFEKEDNVDKDKEGLTPFVAKAYHDHINLNKSEIKTEVLENTLPSAMLRPILASIVTDEETGEKDFGSHDFVFEEDEDGNEKIKYIEQPVGVIFGDNTIEYDEENDVNRAILHGYLYNEYCQDAVDIMNRRKTVDCSVELSIREMSFNAADKVLSLDDFYVAGLTLLGSKVKPGMKGSKVTIEDFNKTNNSIFSNNEKVIELLEALNITLSNFNKDQNLGQNNEKEGGNETNMNKFEELLAKYGKTAEDIEFDYAELSDEELEAKFEELFGENAEGTDDNTDASNDDGSSSEPSDDDEGDGTADPEPEVNTDDSNNADGGNDNGEGTDDGVGQEQFEKMTRSFELSHDDIRYALYNLLIPYEEADNDYFWIMEVFDSYFVYQGYTGKVYGQKYAKDGDNVAFDGERYELFLEYLTESEKTALADMRSNYSSVVEELNTYKSAEVFADKMTVFDDEAYSDYLETDEFKALMSEESVNQYSKEELAEKADATLGKLVKKNKTFSFANTETKKRVNRVAFNAEKETEDTYKPYGDLFDE